jgi:hypothetical protein
MDIHRMMVNNRLMKALTGVSKEEFLVLLPTFTEALYVAKKKRVSPRQRKVGAGQKGTLKTDKEKLAFILIYLKCYPTFDVLGFLTGRDRTRACRGMHQLLPVLETTLGRNLVLPERKIRSVEEFLEKFPEAKDIFFDGSERPVQKPKNQKRKKKLYSGKKKQTTRKNIVVTNETKKILILAPTKSGRRHDKRLADKFDMVRVVPKDVTIWVDTGFQGIQSIHANTMIPIKATKTSPLTEVQKQNNRTISGIRIVVEHALAGLKRLKAASDIYRNRIPNTDDRFNLLSAGLWNFHLQQTA